MSVKPTWQQGRLQRCITLYWVLPLSTVSKWELDYDVASDEATLLLTPFLGIKDNNEVDFNSVQNLEFETNRMFGANLQLSGENYRWNLSSSIPTLIERLRLKTLVLFQNKTTNTFNFGR